MRVKCDSDRVESFSFTPTSTGSRIVPRARDSIAFEGRGGVDGVRMKESEGNG